MKTVKDAVRELKGVWPDEEYSYMFSTGDAWDGNPGIKGDLVCASSEGDDGFGELIVGPTGWQVVCTRSEFEREAALQGYRSNAKEWKDGVPPVGTHCEVLLDDSYYLPIGEQAGWMECVVLPLGWLAVESSKKGGIWSTIRPSDGDAKFRPIQSERDKAVEEIGSIIMENVIAGPYYSQRTAEAIYKAGYRKVEQ